MKTNAREGKEKRMTRRDELTGRAEKIQIGKLGEPDSHVHLLAIMPNSPTDFEPYGYRLREGADCSCGCRWFLPLQCQPTDWGVCSNPRSPRCGLLTFEHMGCPEFEADALDEQGNVADLEMEVSIAQEEAS